MSRALVVVERTAQGVRRASLEALGRVRELGLQADALVTGGDPQDVAPYADAVLHATGELVDPYNADVHVPMVEKLVRDRAPLLVLAPATSTGRDLTARLAARLHAPYAAEVTELSMTDGACQAVRPVHGGKAFATLAFEGEGPFLFTVRANAFAMPQGRDPGEVMDLDPGVDPASVPVKVTSVEERSTDRVPLGEAQIVVTGGRGMGSAEHFALLEKLADALGGAVGASRAVVDAGWRDVAEQVGKSGNTVAPSVYVAFGVSGAVHHVMGMDGATTVVVVNRDENALFFEHADHGVVADALQLLPRLIEELGG